VRWKLLGAAGSTDLETQRAAFEALPAHFDVPARLLRHERELPGGHVVRSDFLAFEILPATPENRRLLEIQAPAAPHGRRRTRSRRRSSTLR